MYYRDLILSVDDCDKQFFMTQLVTALHEKHSQLPVAITFPNWEAGTPNRLDNFDTWASYANVGNVLRLFSEHADILDSVIAVLGLEVLVKRNVLVALPVKEAPSTGKYAAFCRVRSADNLASRSKGRPLDVRRAMEDKVQAIRHTLAYLRLTGKSGQNQRSMYFTKVVGAAPADSIEVNSFGLSAASAPCFLPDF